MESRILQLISALRASGVRVSLAESSEAFTAVEILGIHDREHFRLSLRTTLIKDTRDLPVFDKLFPQFFGSAQPPLMGGNAFEQLTPEETALLTEALRQLAEDLRDRMQRIASGEPLTPEELEALGLLAGLNRADGPRYQNWRVQRMLQALAFPDVREALQQFLDQLVDMGMDGQRVDQLSTLLDGNLRGMEKQIRQFVGQRLAENMTTQPPADVFDGLVNRSFQALSDADKKMLQREVNRLAAALKTRIALRQKRAKTGQLDPKATIRANLRYYGVPMELRHRDHVRKPKLVLICDVSTSMRFCAELMLSFLFALQGQVRKTAAFAFIDHLEFISEDFRSSDPNQAIAAVLQRMPSGHYNTNLGWSLHDFNTQYLDTLTGDTTLIVLGDGRNNYNDPRLDLFALMSRRAARTIWLNPEPPPLWVGDSDMPRYAPLCDEVLKVGNLRELAAAVDQLLSR